jgi:hypothetical protein
MAYLSPHFEHDVFVSFSHGDPRGTGNTPLKKWTFELLHELEDHILAIDPEFVDVIIWRDEKLDPTLHLTTELKARVKSSGILFIVMSPHYLKSRWCNDELTWFREQIQDRAQDPERVFIIRALRTDASEWPEFLRDERGFAPIGFSFHHPQNDTPYRWAGSRESDDEYLKCLGTLRTTLTQRLRELRDRAQKRAEIRVAPRRTAGGMRRIFLYARTEDAPLRQEVHRLLFQDGVTPISDPISPGKELADWTRESNFRIEAAKRCDALALVRAEEDENFVDTLLDIGLSERETIKSARGFPLPCAVLDQSGEELPIDVSGWGIERFDLRNDHWRGDFRQWLDRAEAQPVAARQ